MTGVRPWGRAASTVTGLAAVLILGGCQNQIRTFDNTTDDQARAALAAPGDTWINVGKRALVAGEYDLALEAFQQSLLAEGPTAEAFTGAGVAAEHLGLQTMAARHFAEARDLAPNSVAANNNLGVVLFRLKEYYPARQAFQTAFALSGGRDGLAIENLRKVEVAIAEIEAGQMWVDPAVNYSVRRLGSSEFELTGVPDEEPITSRRTVAVEDDAPAPAPEGGAAGAEEQGSAGTSKEAADAAGT